MTEYITEWYWDERRNAPNQAQREEIVRCRDCKYRYGCLHLVDDGDDDMRRCVASPDNFCAWGELRGEGDTE